MKYGIRATGQEPLVYAFGGLKIPDQFDHFGHRKTLNSTPEVVADWHKEPLDNLLTRNTVPNRAHENFV